MSVDLEGDRSPIRVTFSKCMAASVYITKYIRGNSWVVSISTYEVNPGLVWAPSLEMLKNKVVQCEHFCPPLEPENRIDLASTTIHIKFFSLEMTLSHLFILLVFKYIN